MAFAETFIRRTNRDIDEIADIALRAAVKISGKLRARYVEEFKTGHKFLASDYIIQQYKPILLNTLIAGHLAGYNRTYLMIKQSRELLDRIEESGIELVLSELSDTLSILQKKTFLNLDRLQKKYSTQALKILNTVSKSIEDDLQTEFRSLIEEGVTTNEAVKRLTIKFDQLGLTPLKPYQLETMFRTQLQMSFAAGRYQAEQNPDIDEILWGYKYSTVGDDRVRDQHAALEGVTLPKSDPFWQRFYPPNGWNCRCQAIPLFEEREIVQPPILDENGNSIEPDKGFDFNPGVVFSGR